jgi:16S rRNA (guanine966-N2)-methyltransferase
VLDLFAGSGALGIEALSRGAAAAVFVERDRRALATIARNVEAAGVGERASLRRMDAAAYCAVPLDGPFDLVLADPPYERPFPAVLELLATLSAAGGLAPGATLVVERDRRDPALGLAPPRPLVRRRHRTYGDTVLVYLEAQGAASP